MFLALAIMAVYCIIAWLVFFHFKLLKFSIGWGLFSTFFLLHVLLIVLIGLRFVTPYSTDAKVIQHTIQLIPRLPEPTLVTGVLVEPNTPVKKGQPLFQFDRRLYQDKVNGIKAQLAAAEQRVLELKAGLDAASAGVAKAKGQRSVTKGSLAVATASVAEARAKRAVAKAALAASAGAVAEAKAKQEFSKDAFRIAEAVRKDDSGGISKLRYDQARQGVVEAEAAVQAALANEQKARAAYEEESAAIVLMALADEQKARLAYTSQINGENTTVAKIRADLSEAQYYLDNCTMVAPEDGYVINLQVRPGMVAGTFRVGAIASFVVDADRYVLATYYQENLKYVKGGQYVEVAFDLYPGQIFKGKVRTIWQGSGQGQMLPSGDLPKFTTPPPETPQGRFAVQIEMDGDDQSRFPIGAQGASAIYVHEHGAFPVLRRIGIRARTWLNWLYPLNI